MRALRPRASVAYVYFLDIVAATASCSSATITSQGDADTISSCSTITGDLVLATNSAGSIALDGVQVIEGSFTSEPCSSGSSCSGLVSLSSSTLTSVSHGVTLQSFSNLTTISFPQLLSTGSAFSLEDLPALQNVTVPQLASTADFHISNTPKFTNLTLDLLQNVSSVSVVNVGLSTFPMIVSASEVTSFIVSGVNNLPLLTIDTPLIGLLDIQGNGSLGLILNGYGKNENNNKTIFGFPISSINTLNLFGIGSIAFPLNTTITNFNSTNNNFPIIGFNEITGLTNIYIIDNPLLKSITWPKVQILNNITITGNANLTETVGWIVQNVTNFYVTGSFDNDFVIEMLVDFVSGNYLLNSTQNITCDLFDGIRLDGHVKGNYSCQGLSVAPRSGAGSDVFRAVPLLLLAGILTAIFCNY